MHVFVTVIVAIVRMGRRFRRAGGRRGRGNRKWEGGDGVVVVIGGMRVSVRGLPVFAMRMVMLFAGMIMTMVMLLMRMVVFVVRVVMAPMRVAVFPAMVVASMSKCIHSDQVNNEAKTADGQQLSNSLHLTSFD